MEPNVANTLEATELRAIKSATVYPVVALFVFLRSCLNLSVATS